MANKFKKGDQIIVISGSDKGKIGKIISVLKDRVVVEGVRMVTIHKKPTGQQLGQIKKEERSIHISNISHVENGRSIKIKFMINSGGKENNSTKKDRVSKKTGKKIE
jgi:large subunit ribosomal protein L24